MKYFFTLLLSSLTLFSYSQNKGYIYYSNQYKNAEDIEQMKSYGLNVRISPKLISIDSFPRINSLLEDYKTYIKTYDRQINSITFLDSYEFTKLDKRDMKVQSLCYVQYKTKDYKWGGCKYHDIFHVFSDIYFTTYVKEYSDRFEMEVTVAEKRKSQLSNN